MGSHAFDVPCSRIRGHSECALRGTGHAPAEGMNLPKPPRPARPDEPHPHPVREPVTMQAGLR